MPDASRYHIGLRALVISSTLSQMNKRQDYSACSKRSGDVLSRMLSPCIRTRTLIWVLRSVPFGFDDHRFVPGRLSQGRLLKNQGRSHCPCLAGFSIRNFIICEPEDGQSARCQEYRSVVFSHGVDVGRRPGISEFQVLHSSVPLRTGLCAPGLGYQLTHVCGSRVLEAPTGVGADQIAMLPPKTV